MPVGQRDTAPNPSHHHSEAIGDGVSDPGVRDEQVSLSGNGEVRSENIAVRDPVLTAQFGFGSELYQLIQCSMER